MQCSIDIRFRYDVGLNNLKRLKIKVRYVLHYGGPASCWRLCYWCAQFKRHCFNSVYERLGLKINVDKTKILLQSFSTTHKQDDTAFKLNSIPIERVQYFRYLGSYVSSTAKMDEEINYRRNRVSAAIAKWNKRVFNNNKHLKLSTKISSVYKAVIHPNILSWSETLQGDR